ncbi:MAG: hypothetical protein ACTHNU_17330 [Gaiellales bacterium]
MTGLDLGGIAALGAFHGINPAMGWLFAVGLGLQESSRRALARSLGPIAIWHAAAIALVVIAVQEMRGFVSPDALRIAGGLCLAGFAIWKLVRNRHLRWVGFRLRRRELALWSFLMSSAHGAGLMLVPFLLGSGVAVGGSDQLVANGYAGDALAVAVHTAAMVAVAGVVAVLVYELIGVQILRTAWVNLDRFWAMALLVAAGATLLG